MPVTFASAVSGITDMTAGGSSTVDSYPKPNIPLALIGAKDTSLSVGDGTQQALDYAARLDIPFVFSWIGHYQRRPD
jgi:type I site-specific restriction endonuclease